MKMAGDGPESVKSRLARLEIYVNASGSARMKPLNLKCEARCAKRDSETARHRRLSDPMFQLPNGCRANEFAAREAFEPSRSRYILYIV